MAKDLRRALLPYCVKRLEDGSYLLLNRDYKPLGVFSADWVVYEEHPSRFRFVDPLTPEDIRALCVYNGKEVDGLYLCDGGAPMGSAATWKAYSDRMRHLAGLKIEPAQPVKSD